MKRVEFFIDGFNLYHAIAGNPRLRKYKWLDLTKLVTCYTKTTDQIVGVNYFTSYVTWAPDKLNRHQTYTSALMYKGAKIILGNFKIRDKVCRICHKTYQIPEEKQTDVNIAIKLFQSAVRNNYDTAVIVSGDTDLVPAVDAVRETFPVKEIGVVIPIGRRADLLKDAAHFHMKMKEKRLASSLFPDEIEIGEGRRIIKPSSWI